MIRLRTPLSSSSVRQSPHVVPGPAPRVHALENARPELGLIKRERGLIPIQRLPTQVRAIEPHGNARQRLHDVRARTAPAVRRFEEQIFQIPVPTLSRRVSHVTKGHAARVRGSVVVAAAVVVAV